MAPRLNQLNFLAGRRYFIDPQSGQSYRSMIGEGRGIAGGIRDASGAAVPPDVLVVALGTNDVGGAPFAADFNAWKTGLGWIVARFLIDTANVRCKMVMTVRDAGRDPGFQDPVLAAAADAYNQLIVQIVNKNPSAFRLVDWNQLAVTHRPMTPDEWFSVSPFSGQYDRVHPNTRGLNALSDALFKAEQSCLGQ
jgi:lysophospholipase L1-like esterase